MGVLLMDIIFTTIVTLSMVRMSATLSSLLSTQVSNTTTSSEITFQKYIHDAVGDGHVCTASETVFSKNSRSVIGCLLACTETTGCNSAFYEKSKLWCYGCKSVSNLRDLESTVFYKKSGCSAGLTQFGDSCYRLSNSESIFEEGVNFCEQIGGHVVIIETEAENEFLKSYMNSQNADEAYINLVYNMSSNSWEWFKSDITVYQLQRTVLNLMSSLLKDPMCAVLSPGNDIWQEVECSSQLLTLCEVEIVNPT